MVRAVGATFERTHSPKTALRDATRAARAVVQDRRTVVLSLPVDVQDADLPIAYEYERGVIHSTLPAPDPKAIAAAAEELSRSKRPLILAGRGAVVAKAKQSLVSLADEVGALLATSAFAHGLSPTAPGHWVFLAASRLPRRWNSFPRVISFWVLGSALRTGPPERAL
jgi:thiamine pyrophosphate-dependent acetolactate synthase large subunit-like protein